MQEILVVKREDLSPNWLPSFGFVSLSEEQFRNEIRKACFYFLERNHAEVDENYKQLIPYMVIINNQSEILCYQRHGREERLNNFYSAGIGGHIEKHIDGNKDIESCIYNGAARELFEETGLEFQSSKVTFHGIINEEKTKVGRVHLGIVFSIIPENHNFLRISTELKDYHFCGLTEFIRNKKYEYWSGLALNLIQQKQKNHYE